MFRFLFGLFIILHGLVHLWFFTLSQGFVKFEPGIRVPGWTGKSWLFTGFLGDSVTRSLASILFIIATIAFVVSGFGIFIRAEWWWKLLMSSAIFSSAILILLWDGKMQLLVDKGVIGLLISLAILAILFTAKRPVFGF